MKKLMALACASLMAASVVTGCTSSGGGEGDTAKKDVPTTEDGKRIMTFDVFSGGNGEQVWSDLEAAYEKGHEDVDVQLHFSKELPDDLNKKNMKGEYSDLVYYNLGQASGYTETQLNSNKVMDISDVMKEVANDIDTNLTDATAQYFGDGKSYLAPIMYTPAGLYYNKKTLSENELPKTWDEMFALGEKVHKENKDTYLFTYPIKGYFDNTILGMLYQAGGEEYFQNALKYKEGTWDSDAGKKITETLAKLVSKNNIYLEPNTVANANVDKGFTKNQQSMIDGKALFMPNGSWIINEMIATTPSDFEWGVMPLPAFEDGGDRVVTTMTEQVWIPSEAANPDDAKDFIKFLYSEDAAKIFAQYKIVTPRKGAVDLLTDETIVNKAVESAKAQAEKDGKEFTAENEEQTKTVMTQLHSLFSIYNDESVKAVSGTYAAYDATKLPDLDFKAEMYGPIDDLASGKKDVTAESWQKGLTSLWSQVAGAPIESEK